MRKYINHRRKAGVLSSALMALALAAASVAMAAPPPPAGPPTPILTGLAISGPSEVDMGSPASFSCVGIYSDGSSSALNPVWGVDTSDAAISSSGLLTVANISSDRSASVRADYAGFTATLNITLVYIAPVLTGITINGASVINEETSVQYSCLATYSDGSSGLVFPAWGENSPSTTISASGLLSAGAISSDQNVTLTASYGGKSDTHAVVVKYVPPAVLSLVILGPSNMNEGTLAQFVCRATYADGSTAVVTPVWGENSSSTIISSMGWLRAGDLLRDQSVVVSASFGGKFDTHAVIIKYIPPTLSGIVISGPTRVNEETSAQYVCTAHYSDGTSASVSASWSENSLFTSLSASGVLTAGNVESDQTVTITVNFEGKSDTLSVVVAHVAPPVTLTTLTLAGPSIVEENSTAHYVCTAYYSDGSQKVVAATWSENSAFASMNGFGILDVKNVAADETVTVTASFEGKIGALLVAIQAIGDQVIFPLTGFEGKIVSAELWDETAQEMTDLGQDTSPKELVIENVNPGQWYWLGVREFDEASGEWTLVYGGWMIL